VEDHYRYYQFYSNTLVALTLLAVARLVQPVAAIGPERLLDMGIVVLVMLFGAGSRDTLRRYYSRASVVMEAARKARSNMTNGSGVHIETAPQGPSTSHNAPQPDKDRVRTPRKRTRPAGQPVRMKEARDS
jgi:hypothetical protein